MNKKNLLKFSWINFAIGAFLLAVSYFFFHFVTDEGITLVWHPEAQKWFVTLLIGIFAVLFLFAGVISLLSAWIFFKTEEDLSK